MQKHKSIKALVSLMQETIELSQLEIVDYWDADLCAIGLKKNDKLIYISTSNYLEQLLIKYDYEIELKDESAA